MIKLKYADLIGLNPGLNKITQLSQKEDSKVSFKLSVQVSTLIKKLAPVLETYEKEREALIKKYAKPVYKKSTTKFDEDGEPQMENSGEWNFETEKNKEAFNKEISDLLNTEVEFDGMFQFDMKDLSKLSKHGFGVQEVTSIMPLIKDLDDYSFDEGGETPKE